MGAKYMTMLVNLNIVSDRLDANSSIGRRFSSLSRASEIAKSTLNTTIWRTCPSATDLATFSGNTCRITSVRVCFWPCASAWGITAGGCTPTPALVMLMAARPMNSAIVVTASK
jgi:hypothetical protein